MRKLSRFNLAAFSFMAIPLSALGLPFVVHLPAFYKNEIGISATAVGLVVMLARFWDVFTDPLFGAVSDHVPTRWGRRRPWIVAAIPLQLVCAWYLFMPEAGATELYLGFWLFCIYVTSTMTAISHMSWGAELSPDYHDRSRIQGYREVGLIIGMVSVLVLPVVVGAVDRTETVYVMGLFIMISLPICALVTLVGTPKEQERKAAVSHLNVKEALLFFASDPYLRRLLLVAMIGAGLLPGITGALYLDTITHVFGLGEERNLLLLIYFSSAVLSIPLWIYLSKVSEKHRAFSFAMFYGAVILSMAFILPRGSFWWMFFGLICYGVSYGAGPFLIRALTADFADFDELKSGRKRTGLCFSMVNMIEKIGIALSVGITFPLLDLIGFHDKQQNSPETIEWLLVIYVVPSCLLMLIAGVMMWNYPIDKKRQEDIQTTLIRKGAESY